MYPDFTKGGFSCRFCGGFSSWGADVSEESFHSSRVHKSIPMVEGDFDVSSFSRAFARKEGKAPEMAYWNGNYSEAGSIGRELGYDAEAWNRWQYRELITAQCSSCGATISGLAQLNLFKCDYCRTVTAVEDVLGSDFEKISIIGHDDIPVYAIPFRLTSDEAKESILRLLEDNFEALEDQNIPERLEKRKRLRAMYLPYEICDFGALTLLDCDRGTVHLYQEVINMATPLSLLYAPQLINHLTPWDFSETVPFRPSYLEDAIRLIGIEMEDYEEVNYTRRRLFEGAVLDYAKEEDSLLISEHRLETIWQRNYVSPSFRVMLPVFYLPELGGLRLNYTIAVNGQTGRASGMITDRYYSDGAKNISTDTDSGMFTLSNEVQIASPFMPVIKNPLAEELYQPVSYEQAFMPHSKEELKRRRKERGESWLGEFLSKA